MEAGLAAFARATDDFSGSHLLSADHICARGATVGADPAAAVVDKDDAAIAADTITDKRDNAVAHLREVMGATDVAKAADGTIRKRFGTSIERNAIHGSDSDENGAMEIAFAASNALSTAVGQLTPRRPRAARSFSSARR